MTSASQKDNAQNRLLLATAVLAFIYYAGAKFQGLTVAGATVTFSNEGAVLEFTWFIWFYYYMRCYQYYKKLGVANFRLSLNESYLASFGHRLLKLDRHEFELLPEDDGVKASTIRLGWGKLTAHERERRSPPSYYDVAAYANRMRAKRSLINLIRPRFIFRRVRGRILSSARLILTFRLLGFRAVVYPPDARNSLRGQTKYTVSLPLWMPMIVLAVYLRTALARPEFIENQGPLVLGLIPVWYLIARDWHAVTTLLH